MSLGVGCGVTSCVGNECRPGWGPGQHGVAWEGSGREAVVGVLGKQGEKDFKTGIKHFSNTWLSLSLKIKARPLLERSIWDSAGKFERLGRSGW